MKQHPTRQGHTTTPGTSSPTLSSKCLRALTAPACCRRRIWGLGFIDFSLQLGICSVECKFLVRFLCVVSKLLLSPHRSGVFLYPTHKKVAWQKTATIAEKNFVRHHSPKLAHILFSLYFKSTRTTTEFKVRFRNQKSSMKSVKKTCVKWLHVHVHT